MPDNRNRKRPIQVKFFVDERELGLIKARMAQLGIENMSAYLRQVAIDEYEKKLDMPERREPKKRSSQSHIPFSRQFSCNRRLGNKKSRHINMYRPPEKG